METASPSQRSWKDEDKWRQLMDEKRTLRQVWNISGKIASNKLNNRGQQSCQKRPQFFEDGPKPIADPGYRLRKIVKVRLNQFSTTLHFSVLSEPN